jgi:uncharacterized RDD family membrane protein YckC
VAGGWQVPDPEPGPAPGLAYGGFGARLVAYIVDAIIVTIVIVAVAIVGALAIGLGVARGSASTVVGTAGLLAVAIVVVTVGYFPWFWSRGGATPGMKMFDLMVVRDSDGGPISGGQAFLRLIGYWVSGAVFYLGYIWIFVDKRRRGWHDLIAGTVVVQRR